MDFSMLIEHRQVPPGERIHYLRAWWRSIGGRRNIFSHFCQNAYDEEYRLLDKCFGNAFIAGNAFRDRLERWPKISNRDSKGIQRFADFIKQCETSMNTIGTLNVLMMIVRIGSLCPYYQIG